MSADQPPPQKRRAGRRAKNARADEPTSLTREAIIAHALKIVERESLAAVSIVRLARELNVASSLIHYFFGNKDRLYSAILNEVYRERVSNEWSNGQNWRADLEALIRSAFAFQLKWKGITSYIQMNNRGRLFQNVDAEQRDYGLAFFNRAGEILKSSGMSDQQAAMAYHLLMMFTLSVSFAHVNNQEPSRHKAYLLDRMSKLDPQDFPGAAFMMAAFTDISTDSTFESGLKLLLDSIEGWSRSAA